MRVLNKWPAAISTSCGKQLGGIANNIVTDGEIIIYIYILPV